MAKKAITVYLKSAVESGFGFIERRFKSVQELNENFHAQRDWIFEKLEKKSDYKQRLAKVLEVLKMHSCKHLGISFLTENNLCKAYELQFGQPISKRSVGAYVKQLKEIGFITTIAAKREDGKQTANIVVIEKLGAAGEKQGQDGSSDGKEEVSAEKPAHKDSQNLRTVKTTSPSKTSLKEHKERIAKERRLLNFVHEWFKEKVACCAREAKRVYEYWKITKGLLGRTYADRIEVQDRAGVLAAAVDEFFKACKASARGAFQMKNPYGFFHAVLQEEAQAHIRREAHASSLLFYDWLES